MNRIIIFGKPAGGKSTLARKLSDTTGIRLCPLDRIEYEPGGKRVSPETYATRHAELIRGDRWIIEGLGTLDSFWERMDAADTLIHVDLPYCIHYWWVVKRFLKSVVAKPEGWPEGSSVWKGSVASWRYLTLSPGFWTPELFEKIALRGKGKAMYHIRSVDELDGFVSRVPESGPRA